MPALVLKPAPTASSLVSRYTQALVMPEVAVRLPAVTVIEHGVTRLPVGRVSGERLCESEHFFFWMTVVENLSEYTFQRALSYADPNNVEELALLASTLRLESVEPGSWNPSGNESLALFSKSGEFIGVRLSTTSGATTPEGANCVASIWLHPDSLEKMSLALLAAGVRWARNDNHTPISADLAAVVLPVIEQMGSFAGSAVFMPDSSYGLAGLLEARHALRSDSASVTESDLADLDDLISNHGERYREYQGGRKAYALTVRV